MPTVNGVVSTPVGVVGGTVTAQLVGTVAGQTVPVVGFFTTGTREIVTRVATTAADATGAWSLSLPSNLDPNLSPANTYYQIVETAAGSQSTFYIQVPNGAGPYWAGNIIVQPTTVSAPVAGLGLPVAVTGLPGATAATRYAGGTTSGAPVTGTFAVGDHIVAADGGLWVCTVAGTPGTWVQSNTRSVGIPDRLQNLPPALLGGDGSHPGGITFKAYDPSTIPYGPWSEFVQNISFNGFPSSTPDHVFTLAYNYRANDQTGTYERITTGEHCASIQVESRFASTNPATTRGAVEWHFDIDPTTSGTPFTGSQRRPWFMQYDMDNTGVTALLGDTNDNLGRNMFAVRGKLSAALASPQLGQWVYVKPPLSDYDGSTPLIPVIVDSTTGYSGTLQSWRVNGVEKASIDYVGRFTVASTMTIGSNLTFSGANNIITAGAGGYLFIQTDANQPMYVGNNGDTGQLNLRRPITLSDAVNIAVGSTNGTQIATATTQKIAFYGSTPVAKPTVTGAKGGNAALTSLMTQLAALGLVTDSTT